MVLNMFEVPFEFFVFVLRPWYISYISVKLLPNPPSELCTRLDVKLDSLPLDSRSVICPGTCVIAC